MLSKEDIDFIRFHLDDAFHAIGHAFEHVSVGNEYSAETEIDRALNGLKNAKKRISGKDGNA